MTIAQSSRLAVHLTALLSDSLDLSTVRDDLTKECLIELASGVGSGQANQVFHDTRTVTTGATDSIDLAGVLVNAIRQTVTFLTIKLVLIKASTGNSTILSVTRPANGVPIFAAAADACPVGPGGLFVWASPVAGVTVTPGTGDLLDIVNAAGASAAYDIVIVGTSA